jgi:DNA (cytosine-5)-methyltransferase 3A
VKPLTVLSLFDGISCGRVALQRANIPVAKYYASEIDKYAIQVTKKNWPDTIQLGDVTKIDFSKYAGEIDLLIGGSPCQDLSIAGNRAGLEGERSGLFFKYVEALNTIKPKWFLLENNVGMPQEAYEKISELIGCYPVEINSARVSAQNRRRYYWTNIGEKEYNLFGFPTCTIPQPEDKKIILQDVLESGYGINAEKYAQIINKKIDKSLSLCARDYKGFGNQQMTGVAEPICAFVKKKYDEFAEEKGYIPVKFNPYNKQEITEKAPTQTCASNSQTTSSTVMMFEPIRLGTLEVLKDSQGNRVYSVRGKSVCLNANGGGCGVKTGLYKIDLPDGDYRIRKLTPLECERLQTLPDRYTDCISDSQRYKCIGNGWTVDVIAHIFSFIPKEDK